MNVASLHTAWTEVASRIVSADRLWIGTDFDGTLTHHVHDPFAVMLRGECRTVLDSLSRKPGVSVSVISGRSLADLIPRVGLTHLGYSGNHGLEIQAGDWGHRIPDEHPVLVSLHDLVALLDPLIRAYPQAFIEFKQLTASVHYRLTPESFRAEIRELIDRHMDRFALLQASHSDAGTELRPLTGFHKGEAAEMLIQRQADESALPVYFGDHETDEDAFRSLHRGITVKVGPGDTSARYRVADADEVLEFMNRIDRLRL